jgi:nicotinate phosphoribosyltransferase
MVYKLVERDGRPVAKRSEGKRSVGGRKSAVRRHDDDGIAVAEVVSSRPIPAEDGDRNLIVPLVRAGARCSEPSPAEALAEARAHHERARAALPPEAWALSRGEPVLETLDA